MMCVCGVLCVHDVSPSSCLLIVYNGSLDGALTRFIVADQGRIFYLSQISKFIDNNIMCVAYFSKLTQILASLFALSISDEVAHRVLSQQTLNIDPMLGQLRRRWTYFNPTLGQHLEYVGIYPQAIIYNGTYTVNFLTRPCVF